MWWWFNSANVHHVVAVNKQKRMKGMFGTTNLWQQVGFFYLFKIDFHYNFFIITIFLVGYFGKTARKICAVFFFLLFIYFFGYFEITA